MGSVSCKFKGASFFYADSFQGFYKGLARFGLPCRFACINSAVLPGIQPETGWGGLGLLLSELKVFFCICSLDAVGACGLAPQNAASDVYYYT